MSGLLILLTLSAIALLTLGATAVSTVSRLWLRHWIEHQPEKTRNIAAHLERPARLVHAAGTAAMLLVFVAGALLALADGSRTLRFALDIVFLLALVLVFGQLLPRAIARRWAPEVVPVMVPMLRAVAVIVAPFQATAGWIRRMVTSVEDDSAGDARDELEHLLRDSALDDLNTAEEMAIISGVMQFGEKSVGDIMRPLSEVFSIPAGLSSSEVARLVSESGYSRVPVFEGDHTRIVGMVHVMDVFKSGGESVPPLLPVTRTVPEKMASELLSQLLRERRQLAIVQTATDSNASAVGMVTLEDLLEELVGDIRDEHDDSTD